MNGMVTPAGSVICRTIGCSAAAESPVIRLCVKCGEHYSRGRVAREAMLSRVGRAYLQCHAHPRFLGMTGAEAEEWSKQVAAIALRPRHERRDLCGPSFDGLLPVLAARSSDEE